MLESLITSKTRLRLLIKFFLNIANKGWIKACQDDSSLKHGLNIIKGDIVYKAVADAFSLDYKNINEII